MILSNNTVPIPSIHSQYILIIDHATGNDSIRRINSIITCIYKMYNIEFTVYVELLAVCLIWRFCELSLIRQI